MGVGTVDEKLLERYGGILCKPTRGRCYSSKEIHGVGFGGEFKVEIPRFIQDSRSQQLH